MLALFSLIFSFLPALFFARGTDFDAAVGMERLGRDFICHYPLDEDRYTLYRKLWDDNASSQPVSSPIPKVIYQIWLRKEALPAKYKRYQQSWVEEHPTWKYEFWTLEDLDRLEEGVRGQIEKAESVQEKEDFLRLYLLEHYGGVCVDIASMDVASLDELCQHYHFFASLEPPLAKKKFERRLHVATSFIGAIKSHPIILAWKREIEIGGLDLKAKDRPWQTYLLFGIAVDNFCNSSKYKNIVLPPTYAFPIRPESIARFEKEQKKSAQDDLGRGYFSLSQLWKEWFGKEPLPFSTLQPETIAVHMRGGTWGNIKHIKTTSSGKGSSD